MLFNTRRYDLAGKYLDAAQMYSDRLTASEQTVLEVYREKLDEYRRDLLAAKPSAQSRAEGSPRGVERRVDARVVPVGLASSPAADVVREPPERSEPVADVSLEPTPATRKAETRSADPPPRLGLDRGPVYGSASWRDSATEKEKARWLMQLAREQIYKGHYDLAEQAIAEAKSMDVKWTVFDETPEKMTEALLKAKDKKAKETTNPTDQPRDRRASKIRLRDARAALAGNDLDRAESIAREVKSWQLSYGFFDDTPERVSAAVADARHREAVRKADMTIKPYRSIGPGSTTPPSQANSTEPR
jgi:hypothetical protein